MVTVRRERIEAKNSTSLSLHPVNVWVCNIDENGLNQGHLQQCDNLFIYFSFEKQSSFAIPSLRIIIILA